MQKTADFRIISFPAHKSKEDLHLSEVLYVREFNKQVQNYEMSL